MNLLKGVGKAGTNILGGVTKGVGQAVETAGDVAEKAPVVGGIGTVVEGAGEAIEKAGEATKDFGEKAFENKENKPKKGLKEVILHQMEEDGDDDVNEYDKEERQKRMDDLKKLLDAEKARQEGRDDDELTQRLKDRMSTVLSTYESPFKS